jgi:hypothetical protein
VICICRGHHHYFKQKDGGLYWDIVKKHIGEKNWAWFQKVSRDRKAYKTTAYDWGKAELHLKQELESYANC